MIAPPRRSIVLVVSLSFSLLCSALASAQEEFTCAYDAGGGFAGAGASGGGCQVLDAHGPNSLLVMLVDNDGVPGVPADKPHFEFVMSYVAEWYDVVSGGRTSQTSNVRDWVTTKSTDLHAGEQLALETAVAQGVPVTDYDQLVFFHTRAHPNGYGGFHMCSTYDIPGQGMVSWRISEIFAYGPFGQRRVDVIHELGHGYGLGHASHINPSTGTVDTYGDQTDPMGNGRSIGAPGFNAAFLDFLGWLDPGEIETVTSNGTWTLSATGPRVLKVLNPHRVASDGRPVSHYVEYRPPIGKDEPLGDYYNATVGVQARELYSGNQTRSIDSTPESPSTKTNDFALMPGRSLVVDERVVVSCLSFDPTAMEVTVRVEFTEHGNGFPNLDGVQVTTTSLPFGGSSTTLNADATDPDGDPMLYFWATGIDPFQGEFYGTADAKSGQEITLAPLAPSRVHLLVSDARGHDTGFTPVDLGASSDSIHEVPSEYSTIQAAIDAAGPGDLVLVGAGLSMFGAGNREITLPAGVPMTVRSAQGPSETVIECLSAGRGFFLNNAIDHRSVVTGFTVRHGAADQGAGAYIGASATPTVTNCVFELGDANEGGGVYIDHGTQTPRFYGNTMRDNTSEKGGGLHLAGSYLGSNPLFLRELTIESNTASGNGGGVFAEAFAHLANVAVTDNDAGVNGGGVYARYPVRISDAVVTGNSAVRGGGFFGLLSQGFGTQLWSATFADNVAQQNGGGLYLQDTFVTMVNGIVYDNVPDSYVILMGTAFRFKPTWSDIEGGAGIGVGVFDADPLFSSTEPYHLSPGSPCIDRGDGAYAMWADAAGRERLDDPTVPNQGTGDPDYADVGAFEARLAAPSFTSVNSYSAVGTLSWTPTSGSFRLERSGSPWGPYSTFAYPTGSTWHDFYASTPSPSAFDWYRVVQVDASGESAPSRPTLAIPICARLAHVAGEPFKVDAADDAVFLTLLNQPWQPLSVYADLTGGFAGLPDGQVTEVDHETFLLWLGWEEPR